MSASLPASDTSLSDVAASQYFAIRSLTPAAAAQWNAVLAGQMPRAARANFVVQSIAPRCNPLPRFSVEENASAVDDSRMALLQRYKLQTAPLPPGAEEDGRPCELLLSARGRPS